MLQKVNMAVSSVRKTRDSLLMDNKDSSTCLSSQLVIQEERDQPPILLVPCNAEEKVNEQICRSLNNIPLSYLCVT